MSAGHVVDFPSPSQDRVKKTLIANGYEAFLYEDSAHSLVHYVITRKGEAEIVMWGQENSVQEAEQTAKEWMVGFTARRSG